MSVKIIEIRQYDVSTDIKLCDHDESTMNISQPGLYTENPLATAC